jgi:hypothetical protein
MTRSTPRSARLAIVDALTLGGAAPLDEMRDLLTVLDALNTATGTDRADWLVPRSTPAVTVIREQLGAADGFANTLRAELDDRGWRPHYLRTAVAWPAAACSVRLAATGTASPSRDRAASGVGRGHRGAPAGDGWSARVL